jgi:hypothetical protein
VTSADPCTGARKAGHRSGADSPRGIDHGQFDGARVPPRWSGPQGAIGRSRRIGSVLEGYAALGRRPRVTLRFATLHFARPAAGIQEPHERGTGGRSWGHLGGNVVGAARDVQLPADHIRFAAAGQFCSDQADKTGYVFLASTIRSDLIGFKGGSYGNCSASVSIDRWIVLSHVRCDLCVLVCRQVAI